MIDAAVRALRVGVVVTLVGSFLLVTGVPASAGVGEWNSAGTMAAPRSSHTATLLPNGKVLVAGGNGTSAELYDPATNSWSQAASMSQEHDDAAAALLPNGKVLIAGGWFLPYPVTYLASAELYDPTTNTWSPTGSMALARRGETATLLGNGKVLVVGGSNATENRIRSAELYDPATGTWSSAGKTATGRIGHTATLLGNGEVLVAGGYGGVSSAELYDPTTNTWSSAGSMSQNRAGHTATLLPSGNVLVAGGTYNGLIASAQLYDPTSNSWSPAASMARPRAFHSATLLGNGQVLVAGGPWVFAEVYDPGSNSWSSAGMMADGPSYQTATLLGTGQVLLAGGFDYDIETTLASAERYDPAAPPTTEERDPAVQFDGWVGFVDPSSIGGMYRASKKAKDTARFTFTGTLVQWWYKTGPDEGMAEVLIDGVSQGTFDLYHSSPGGDYANFAGLADTSHAIVVKALGTKNAASTGTWVTVDAFWPKFWKTEEFSPAVKLGNWAGQVDINASGGAYRISSTAGSLATFPFTGTSVDWVTATGPKYGQAEVTIDGASMETVDLYSPTTQWRVHESYSGLSPGPHTIVVKVLGTKNPSSKGTGVVVDAFTNL